jgi:hypothetical protein
MNDFNKNSNDTSYRKEWTSFDHLYASPYGSKIHQAKLEEQDFYDNYFVVLNNFGKIKEGINKYFDEAKKETPSFISIYGYAGTGKTTFLHWYLKNNLPGHNKVIFNLTDEITNDGERSDKSIPIFDVYYRRIVNNFLDANVINYRNYMINLLYQLKSNKFHLTGRFSNTFINQIDSLHTAICGRDNTSFMDIIDKVKYPDLLYCFYSYITGFQISWRYYINMIYILFLSLRKIKKEEKMV